MLNVQRQREEQGNYKSEPPQATVEAWLNTPYARCIEQYVRKSLKEEIIREYGAEKIRLTQALEDESQRRVEAETRASKLEEQVAQLQQEKGDLKRKVHSRYYRY